MNHTINGTSFVFDKYIRKNDGRRRSFDALAQAVFGLSFEDWYRAGYWDDAYQPYTLSHDGRVVACVAVNKVVVRWRGKLRRYIQLGTVMTHADFRGSGLSGWLMERVLADWADVCDGMYLYANDSVRGFYPRYGFVPAVEYSGVLGAVQAKAGGTRRLCMSTPADVQRLHSCYRLGNPLAELTTPSSWGLLMFHCSSHLKDCVYYSEEFSTAVIARPEGDTLTVFDIYGDVDADLHELIGAVADAEIQKVQLGFALRNGAAKRSLLKEEDTTLFVLADKENLFARHQTMFPLLSRA